MKKAKNRPKIISYTSNPIFKGHPSISRPPKIINPTYEDVTSQKTTLQAKTWWINGRMKTHTDKFQLTFYFQIINTDMEKANQIICEYTKLISLKKFVKILISIEKPVEWMFSPFNWNWIFFILDLWS
jgi:hypothetical protein